jgi:hypothetical protein
MPYALGSGGFPFFQLPLQPPPPPQQQQLSSQNQTNR